jgi:hypothetical protein
LLDCSEFGNFVITLIDIIDGNNTFHGMGIIACATPGKQKSPKEIPRVEVTTEELISIGHINVFHYKSDQRGNLFTSMRFRKIPRKINTTW